MSPLRKIVFYAILVLTPFVLAFVFCELLLASMTVSSGTGMGFAGKRGHAANWKPINSFKLRDFEPERRPDHKAAVFIGDSFTQGYGVRFDETFYFVARERTKNAYDAFNAGRNGASTRDVLAAYREYTSKFKIKPDAAVWQYLGNDIDDRGAVPKIQWTPNPTLHWLGQYSEVFNFLEVLSLIRGPAFNYYVDCLKAYEDAGHLQAHVDDIKAVFGAIHADSARVVLVIFPFLTDGYIDASGKYIAPVKDVFRSSCRNDDVVLDVTGLAKSLSEHDRVVAMTDLHKAIGGAVARVMAGQSSDADSKLILICQAA